MVGKVRGWEIHSWEPCLYMVIPEWITYLSDKDPSSVKFFDETRFNCQIVDIETTVTLLLGNILLTCNVTYHAPTLLSQFFLAGIDRVKYANIVQGASNSIECQIWHRSGLISLKKSSMSNLSAISRTELLAQKILIQSAELQMFHDQSCQVWHRIRACFGVRCSRLDASDGNS